MPRVLRQPLIRGVPYGYGKPPRVGVPSRFEAKGRVQSRWEALKQTASHSSRECNFWSSVGSSTMQDPRPQTRGHLTGSAVCGAADETPPSVHFSFQACHQVLDNHHRRGVPSRTGQPEHRGVLSVFGSTIVRRRAIASWTTISTRRAIKDWTT